MSIRKSLLLFLVAALVAFSGITAFVMQSLMASSFRQLELRAAKEDTARIAKFFDEAAQQLSSKAHDWSIWDELWTFAQDGNDKFFQENVTPEAFKTLKVNFIGVYDLNGPIRIGAEYLKQSDQINQTTPLTKAIQAILPDLASTDLEAKTEGMFIVGGRPWILGAHPVRHGDGSGPVAGTVIFARELDQEMLDLAANTVEMQLRFANQEMAGGTFPSGEEDGKVHIFRFGPHPAAVVTSDKSIMQTHLIIKSSPERAEGNPGPGGLQSRGTDVVHILRTSERSIMMLGQETTMRVVAVSALLALLGWGILFLVVWRIAIQRIARFESKLQGVKEFNAETIASVEAFARPHSKNEIDNLAANVSAMMRRASSAEIARDKAQKDLLTSSKMASLGEMAGGIAHEINNPLTVINGRARMLRVSLEKGKLDAQSGLPMIDSIEKTSQRIASIVKALRTYSRCDDADPLRRINIAEAIQSSLDLCREQAVSRLIEIRVDLNGNLPNIPCKEVQLGQVVLNLVKNAIDAVESLPQECRWVSISNRMIKRSNDPGQQGTGREFMEIRVSNGGPKIPAAIKDRLFQPFFTTKPAGKGTGLGLSISASILHQHQGQLYLDDEANHPCFVMEFPLVTTLKVEEPEKTLKSA